MTKTLLLAAAAVFALGTAAQAGPDEPYGSNPNHYYSSNDHDRFDRYERSTYRDDGYRGGGYYYNADNDVECRDNRAGGTIAGALAGGLIGGAASHGNGGAIVGGAILGGLVGNSLSRDVDCYDRSYAYDSYYRGLNGDVGVRVDWRNDRYGDYGYFTPVREYTYGGYRCRDWRSVTYKHGRQIEKTGRACRRSDGQWYFD